MSFISVKRKQETVSHISDGQNLLSVIEVEDNGKYSAAVMHEHASLKNRVRDGVNYSQDTAYANIAISK